jgi:hypothetical protein
VQYNGGGVFAGSTAFNFVPGANPRVEINGTALTTQLAVGGTDQPNNATVYVEVQGDATTEAGTELEFVIMVIAVSCVKLLSAHNSTQHTSRKHKV